MKKSVLLSLLTAWCLGAQATPIVSKTLTNGLQIFVKPDQRIPLALVQLWYKVGSKDEIDGTTGIAHFLEHLMFMGTQQFPGGNFSDRIAALGGSENAQTSRDYTMYYESVPSSAVEKVLQYEADRMRGLQLEPERVKRELQVVAEERRMRLEDRPNALAYEQTMAMVHIRGPYHHMPIGWMSDIKQYTVADAQHWYDQWYHPNNAILVVEGDVDPSQVFKWAQNYFGALPAKALPTAKQQPAPPVRGRQSFVMHDPKIVSRQYSYYYPTPCLRSLTEHPEQAFALQIMTAILAYGESSRLEQALKFKHHLVASVWASYNSLSFYDGSFAVGMTLLPNTNAKEARQILIAELNKMKTHPVSQEELQRAKAQFLSGYIFSQDSFGSVARTIGMYAVLGLSQQQRLQYIKNIEAVTAQQVQDVARNYLLAPKSVVTELLPVANNNSSGSKQ